MASAARCSTPPRTTLPIAASTRVRLWVLVDNSHTRAIYEKRGYRGYEMIYEKDLGKRAP